jgi:hypothetical protein
LISFLSVFSHFWIYPYMERLSHPDGHRPFISRRGSTTESRLLLDLLFLVNYVLILTSRPLSSVMCCRLKSVSSLADVCRNIERCDWH